jgi:hypothetical protein
MTRALALAALALVAACGDDPIVGQPCRIAGDAGNPQEVIVASPSLDCVSRTCLHSPGGDDLCTASCTSDADCEGAADSPCRAGFACAVPVVVGPFACRTMCVCRDDLDGPPALPEVCR